MKDALDFYKQYFQLPEGEFTLISHADTIISKVYDVVASNEHRFILKIYPETNHYLREVYFLQKLKSCIRVPKMIGAIEPASNRFGAILMEHLEGHLLQASDLSHDLAFEIGIALARIHNNQTTGYGDLINPDTFTQDPILYFSAKFEEELNECKHHLPKELIKKSRLYLEKHQTLLRSVDGPCIIHRDFRPGNLIVSNHKLCGIIDWASSRSGFAEQDFCSIMKSIPLKYEKALLEGYATIRPVPNYQAIMPLLELGRSIAVIGFTVKSDMWNTHHKELYQHYLTLLHSFIGNLYAF